LKDKYLFTPLHFCQGSCVESCNVNQGMICRGWILVGN